MTNIRILSLLSVLGLAVACAPAPRVAFDALPASLRVPEPGPNDGYFLNVDQPNEPIRVPVRYGYTQRAPFLTSFYTFRGEEVTSHRLELFEFYSNPGSPGERADGEYPAVALMAWPGEMQYCSPEASIAVQHNTLQSVRAGSLRVLPRCGDATGAGSGALDLQFDLQSGDFGAVQGTVGGTPIDDPVVIPNHVTALDHSRRSWVAFTTLNGGLRAVIEGQGAHQKVLWAQYVDFGRPREVAQMCAGSGSTVELVRQSGAWMVRRVHLEHVAEPVLCSQQSVEPARVELFTKRPPAWEPLPALPE